MTNSAHARAIWTTEQAFARDEDLSERATAQKSRKGGHKRGAYMEDLQ